MVQLYIKHTDNNYYLLDLEDSESINYKTIVKDLSDITKIFSPFTQSFSLKATDKNKMLCGFVGNEKIQRVNNSGQFEGKIYISGFGFAFGIYSFDETDYELNDQKSFKTNFASTITGLAEKLGDSTIQDLFDQTDPLLKIDWSVFNLKDSLSSVKSSTLSSGVAFKYGIPFISNNRAWTYDDENLDTVDNIAFKKARTAETVNQISLSEVRPAINYMSIMDSLVTKIGTPINCPLFAKPELKDLFVWCSSENLVVPDAAAFPLINYTPIVTVRFDEKQQIGGQGLPNTPRWLITGGGTSGVFGVQRNEVGTEGLNHWSDGFDINLTFNDLLPLEGSETKIKVILKNATSGAIIDSKEITGNKYTYRLLDPLGGVSILDASGHISLKFEILPVTLLKWSNIEFKTLQYFRVDRKNLGVTQTTRCTFSSTALNNTSSSSLGGNNINLISTLPKMKCVDFLKSFFMTFNILVVPTGLPDQSMFWLTPSDINEINKPYSKRIVDYTQYVDTAVLNKKKGSQYNQYSFTHFDSKYFDAVDGNGIKFGALMYPAIAPTKPTKFEIKTSYSILKQNPTFQHPSTAKTSLAFANESPTVLENGGLRYKPVFDELTLFYLQPKSLGINTLSVQLTDTANAELFGILEASFKNSFNGKTLAFGAENTTDTNSLYLNYYKSFIELLLSPNTYQSEFTLTLPPNEIFLNFANLAQNEGNIPTGFRAQNEIIIGEQRYSLVDNAIDLTSGKGKINVLNF